MILGHPTTDREDAGVVVSACGCTRPVYVWLVTDDLIAAGMTDDDEDGAADTRALMMKRRDEDRSDAGTLQQQHATLGYEP